MQEITIDLNKLKATVKERKFNLTGDKNQKSVYVPDSNTLFSIYSSLQKISNHPALSEYKSRVSSDLLKIIASIIYTESGGNPHVINIYKDVKAYGLFQFVETTFKELTSKYTEKIDSILQKMYGKNYYYVKNLLQMKSSNYLAVNLPEDTQYILGFVFLFDTDPKLDVLWNSNKLAVLFRNWKPSCALQFADCIKKYYNPNYDYLYNLNLISSSACMKSYTSKLCKTYHWEGIRHASSLLKNFATLKGNLKNEMEVLTWLKNS
ncbi:MAG: transglycosylase SLT domain-containing protein [Candidatus Aenigmatarchaeota archaeon]